MSVQAITWALNFPVDNASEKAVLLVLANYADGEGVCFPGQENIAKQAACSERTVRRVLEAFEQKGIIERQERRRKDGYRTSDCIVLVLFAQPANLSGEKNLTGQSVQSHRPNEQTSPDKVAATYKDDTKVEPSGDPSASAASPSSSPERAAFDEWNALAERLGLPLASKLTDQRKKHLRTRIREDGLEGWRAALAGVERSRHCRGENDRGWRADIDFVLQPKSFTRLIEGFYGSDAKIVTPTAQRDDAWWSRKLAMHREEALWWPELGPPPGQPGCRVPRHLLISPANAPPPRQGYAA